MARPIQNTPTIKGEDAKRFRKGLLESLTNVPMWQLFASPEEVQPKKDGLSLTCPHCGKDINIKVE